MRKRRLDSDGDGDRYNDGEEDVGHIMGTGYSRSFGSAGEIPKLDAAVCAWVVFCQDSHLFLVSQHSTAFPTFQPLRPPELASCRDHIAAVIMDIPVDLPSWPR